jgi:SAM-dependent methyltransferase
MISGEVESGGHANWLWFAPPLHCARALVIGDITPSYEQGLATRFNRIDKIPVATVHRLFADGETTCPTCSKLIYDDGSMDAVISNDLVNQWVRNGRPPFRDPRLLAVLSECHRLLRPGGFLFLSGRNARRHPAWRRTGACLAIAEARRGFAQAGFSDIRSYFVEPSVTDAVAAVIPANRRAALAHERQRLPRGDVAMRTLCAVAGWYGRLYPDAFILAIK